MSHEKGTYYTETSEILVSYFLVTKFSESAIHSIFQPKRPSSGRGRKGSLSKKRPVKRKVPKKGKNSNKLSPDSIDTGDAFESPEKLYEVCIMIFK